MSLIDNVKQHLGIKIKESVDLYCQNCGKNITTVGGDVSSSGRIYCHGYKSDGESRCLDKEMRLMFGGEIPPTMMTFNYYSAGEVQKAIRKQELTQFGPLEQKTFKTDS